MSFLNEMEKTLDNEFNYSITENGALGFRTTGKELLDLNFAVSSLRNVNNIKIKDMFIKAYYENPELALKWLFFARDIREGLGERRLFRVCIKALYNINPNAVKNLIKYIPVYGRWDDLWGLLDTDLKEDIISLVQEQLNKDISNLSLNQEVSLLAKWLPSVNASSTQSAIDSKIIRQGLKCSEKKYRQTLSLLREHLRVVERDMCAKEWGNIDYSHVPSMANIKYNNAFLRNDEERRRDYLDKLSKGETKINSSVVFPHDIVHKYYYYNDWRCCVKEYDETLEQMWKSLPNLVQDDNKTIVVADGSGSMLCSVGNTNVTALEIANGLAIYFSERATGDFANKYITFSSRPQLVDFENCKSLRDKIFLAYKYNEVSNTNIEATFNLILQTAINGRMTQEEMPKNILILSDMEFDGATSGRTDKKLFEEISDKYAEYGYKIPRLIFWNLYSRTNTIPVKENDLGVTLVSGFSPNVLKMVLSDELNPYKNLVNVLMSERYDCIKLDRV